MSIKCLDRVIIFFKSVTPNKSWQNSLNLIQVLIYLNQHSSNPELFHLNSSLYTIYCSMIICTAMLFIAEHFMPWVNKAFVGSIISLLLSCQKMAS